MFKIFVHEGGQYCCYCTVYIAREQRKHRQFFNDNINTMVCCQRVAKVHIQDYTAHCLQTVTIL